MTAAKKPEAEELQVQYCYLLSPNEGLSRKVLSNVLVELAIPQLPLPLPPLNNVLTELTRYQNTTHRVHAIVVCRV